MKGIPSIFERNKIYAIDTLRHRSDILQYASTLPAVLRRDKEVLLVAVERDGEAFEFAAEELKNDKEWSWWQ
jgi:hypothetical protein